MLMRLSLAPEVVPSYYPVVLAALVGAFGSGMCLLVFFGGILRPVVSGSHLFGVRPWSTGLWTFLGEYFRICRVQLFLVQQWIHVTASLRRRVSCWLRCTSRCVPSWFSGPDALHHGRFGPEGQLCGFAVPVHHGRRHPCHYAEAISHGPDCCREIPMVFVTRRCAGRAASRVVVQTCRNCGDSHRCTVCMPVLGASGAVCQTAQKTVEVPQLQFFEGRRLPFRAAETALRGPALLEDHRDSSGAVCCLVVDAPVVHVVLDMPVVVQRQAGENFLEVPQVQYLSRSDSPGSAGRCLRPVHRRDVQVLRRG